MEELRWRIGDVGANRGRVHDCIPQPAHRLLSDSRRGTEHRDANALVLSPQADHALMFGFHRRIGERGIRTERSDLRHRNHSIRPRSIHGRRRDKNEVLHPCCGSGVQDRIENGAIRICSVFWGIGPGQVNNHLGLSCGSGELFSLCLDIEDHSTDLTARSNPDPVDGHDTRNVGRGTQGGHDTRPEFSGRAGDENSSHKRRFWPRCRSKVTVLRCLCERRRSSRSE